MNANSKAIAPGEWMEGSAVSLRLVVDEDCTPRYVGWLADPVVNEYLETRWSEQTLESVRQFVATMTASTANYLFAIVRNSDALHIGNIKLGPINFHHRFADVSYFIGERSCWGHGYATEAIALAVAFAFERLGLYRVQAGLYAGNLGSRRALEKVGFSYECVFREQLVNRQQQREDHLWFGILRREWSARPGPASRPSRWEGQPPCGRVDR